MPVKEKAKEKVRVRDKYTNTSRIPLATKKRMDAALQAATLVAEGTRRAKFRINALEHRLNTMQVSEFPDMATAMQATLAVRAKIIAWKNSLSVFLARADAVASSDSKSVSCVIAAHIWPE